MFKFIEVIDLQPLNISRANSSIEESNCDKSTSVIFVKNLNIPAILLIFELHTNFIVLLISKLSSGDIYIFLQSLLSIILFS